MDLLILGWHQEYIKSYSGGYIRLREFLKRIPKNIKYSFLDNSPSIYSDIVSKNRLIIYSSSKPVKWLKRKLFGLWYMLELVMSSINIYRTANKIIRDKKVKVLYVPIGEFINIFIPSIILKIKYPQVKLVIDILNYGIESRFSYFRQLKKNYGFFDTIKIFIYGIVSEAIIKYGINKADYIFTVSPEMVKRIGKVYHKNTIDYTPSGINSKLSIKFNPNKKYSGIFIGRITAQKGIFDLIRVWAYVTNKNPKALLAIAGFVHKKTRESIEKEIEKFDLKKNIIFFGSVSEEKKFKLLADSQIFIHLASDEPLFPVISILEGFICGLPAIVYDMKVISSQPKFNHSRCLFIVENGNVLKAAERINSFLKLSPKTQRSVFEEAIRLVKEYDWDNIVKIEFNVLFNI